MPAHADNFDLAGLKLSPGEARTLDLEVQLGEFGFSDENYATPAAVPITDLACDIFLYGMTHDQVARSLDLLGRVAAAPAG